MKSPLRSEPGPSSDRAAAARSALRPLMAMAPYVGRYRGRAAAALAALAAAALATLAIPLAVRRMIDIGFSASDAAYVDRAFLVLGALAGGLALASAARYYLVTTLGERVVTDLRRDLFAHLMRLSPSFYDAALSGEILSRLTADTTQIKAAVGTSASVALRNLMLFVGAAIMMVVTSPHLSALVLIAIPFIVLPIAAFGRQVRGRSRAAQDALAEAAAYAGEAVGAVRTIQAYLHEKPVGDRFDRLVERAFAMARGATAARALLTAFAIFLVFASIVGVLWWGAQAVLAGEMTAGRLGQFVLYSVFAAGALGELSQVWGEVSQAAGAIERIVELLRTRPAIEAVANPEPLPRPARGAIAFENVSFAYEGDGGRVLRELSLAVAPGERVALVGPSGAGKSTVFALLMRFYDPNSGNVRLDGTDLRRADPTEVRARLALVPQEPAIFAASAADNIRFGAPAASDQAVREAAKAAHADGFIRELPQGYDTIFGERGVTLSGGQRQRIAIARAILKNAPVLLLDEATSALDAQSEALVQSALDALMRDRTSLVIAHRLATVRRADRIVVMEEGRIVEEGDHASLVTQGGLYARLAALQFDETSAMPPRRALTAP